MGCFYTIHTHFIFFYLKWKKKLKPATLCDNFDILKQINILADIFFHWSIITLPCCIHKGPSSQGYGFSSSHVWMWELDYKESWAPKNWCFWAVVLEKTLQGPLDCKEIQPVHLKDVLSVHWKEWCWSWNANTLATWWEELTHWKRSWCWGRLGAGGEGDDRGWGGWMASPIQWTWVWVGSGSWWWTGRPDVLRFMGLPSRTPLSNWTDLSCFIFAMQQNDVLSHFTHVQLFTTPWTVAC